MRIQLSLREWLILAWSKRISKVVETEQKKLLGESTNAGSHPVTVTKGLTKIPLMQPAIDREMIEAAVEALQNERLVMGESVFKFEEEFANFCGTHFAVSTGSGTAALQIGLQSLGIGRGDRVLTTPFSFFATSNAVLHAEAEPTFADVEDEGFNLDPSKVELVLKPGTRAIIPVHLYGNPARMEGFNEIGKSRDVYIVEDACQAHGAEYKGKRVGSLGNIGCFSFYSSKNMTVGGDGGMITTDNEEVAAVARSLRDCGRSTKYTMARVGYTSRLNTVNAAVGRVQLRRLPEWNRERRRLAQLYVKELEDVSGITLPYVTGEATSAYHLFVVQSPYRDEIIDRLEERGIEAGIHYPVPIHLQTPYRRKYGYKEGDFPVSERLSREVLSLPLYPGMTEEQIIEISEAIQETAKIEASIS